ncbi:MAG: replication-associated recombination protein A, partial [Candidatus Dadabacteria bacterium]
MEYKGRALSYHYLAYPILDAAARGGSMDNLELFEKTPSSDSKRPLYDKIRPASWSEFEGIEGIGDELIEKLKSGKGRPPSLIFWGPPGCGKTTLARLIGKSFRLPFEPFSAVLGGVKEVRAIIAKAKAKKEPTILFVDEIHRFNKAQQDAFLPHIESGTIILMGATTENPSFYLNGALLSRCRVVPMPPLSKNALAKIIERAIKLLGAEIEDKALHKLISYSGGDARRAISTLEAAVEHSDKAAQKVITEEVIDKSLGSGKDTIYYDRAGDEHYSMASAFIKSMRASDPDAALYWGFRMIEGGEDPRFLIRRMIIFASEDIGNADPKAIQLAVAVGEAFDRVGMPEGRIPIAQCITYLSCAPKSNRSYLAMN